MDGATKGVLTCCGLVGLLLTIILVPLSFSYVEYYEYGLAKRKSTGSVRTDRVYPRGRYSLGPDMTFLKYQADSHHKDDSFLVFSAGAGEDSVGLEFRVQIDYTFLLNQDDIGTLHQELAKNYETIIESRARDAVKNEAASVTFTEYFEDRKMVEQRFRDAIVARWDEKPALHCSLDQFHLGRIEIPEAVAEKQLQSRIQNERNEMEASMQQAALERELTLVEVSKIQLEKEKLLRTVNAEADLVRANARAEASQIVRESELNGTDLLLAAAGIESQEEITAFSYIQALMSREKLRLDVSYLSSDNVLRTSVVQ